MPEQTVRVRKESIGSDSFGHEWPEDGAVVEMPVSQALQLLAIRDGCFSIPDDEDDPRPDRPKGRARKAKVTEPAPEPAAAVTEPAPADEPVAEGAAELEE